MTELAQVDAAGSDGERVIRVRGEVDLSNATDVLASIAAAVPGDARRVVLDLTDTSYLDSAGIAMVFRLGERLRDGRQELRIVVRAGSPVRAVLDLTKLPSVIPVSDGP